MLVWYLVCFICSKLELLCCH